MTSEVVDIARLSLMVERLLDAEMLLPEEAGRLLAEAEAVRRLLEEGNSEAARAHLDQFVRFANELFRSGSLESGEVQAVIGSTPFVPLGDPIAADQQDPSFEH